MKVITTQKPYLPEKKTVVVLKTLVLERAWAPSLVLGNKAGYDIALFPGHVSRDTTVRRNAPLQCFGCTCPPTHRLDPLHSTYSFSNTMAVYFKWKAQN